QARSRIEMSTRVADLEEQLADAAPEVMFSTPSAAMRAVLDVIGRTAAHDVPVLLRGESGTGKTVLARALHRQSPRRGRPFAVVNCPALSEELLASEMFGHVKGAFTGAVRDQPGRVEAAEGGTLFLDEVGEVPPSIQAKLLRFLQDKQFERVGETRTRVADVRIVAATNRNLDEAVRAGQFREDLLFRLNVVEVTVPPLRERREEILPLAQSFLAFFARAARRAPQQLSPEAERAFLAYAWPGNVRELRNAIERAVILSPAQVLQPQSFPDRIAQTATTVPQLGGDFSVEQIEREHILRVLARARTQEEAAHVLAVDASTLWRTALPIRLSRTSAIRSAPASTGSTGSPTSAASWIFAADAAAERFASAPSTRDFAEMAAGCTSTLPAWIRARSSRSSTMSCRRSQSSRAACSRSACFSLTAPTVPSRRM